MKKRVRAPGRVDIAKMEIGDSSLVPLAMGIENTEENLQQLRRAVYMQLTRSRDIERLPDYRFSCRLRPEEAGVRVWRVR